MAKEYSKLIGLKKTAKNFSILVLIPLLVYIISNQAEFLAFIPDKYKQIASFIIGAISYYIKNYIENK